MNDIDTLLREDAARLIDDNGFSERVLLALPARRAASRPWWRPALVLGSALLGSVLAVLLSPAIESPVAAVGEMLSSGVLSQAGFTALAIGAVLLLSAVVVAFDSD
jgi:hypothetical protein